MALRRYRYADLPDTLTTPLLTSDGGRPRYWVSVWITLYAGHLAISSLTKKLHYIEAFYQYVDNTHNAVDSLDVLIANCDINELSKILEAYFVSIANRPKLVHSAQTEWKTILAFIENILSGVGREKSKHVDMSEVYSNTLRLGRLYRQLKVQKTKKNNHLRSLPPEVVGELYTKLDPESENNPFKRPRTVWTVYLVFIIILHQGLRSGELLLLQSNAIKSSFDSRINKYRYWLNVTYTKDRDPRHSKPSIKTTSSVRQIPVSELVAKIIQTYVENYRGCPDHPFLLNSQWNTPLSHESITSYFKKISQNISSEVMKILYERCNKKSLTSHDLRHTCAVARLDQLLNSGDGMDISLQKLRSFFGWSRTSTMPTKYAKAVFEDRMAGIWSDKLDERAAFLRSISRT